ncbi:MFS transporter [Micromonospora sp. MED01]|uniref:MFS transporter n=1 Tax=Micromonospora alfalfae TaxID=2911212 RepID=UPI001EE7DA42|nr:MFS transporter [Micromonospora alfalfae]MCG5466732.1 MFS transporter [Micromonospora alfalfae]
MATTVVPTAASATTVGWRLGILYGPAIYGVSAAAVALPVAAKGLHSAPATAVWILTIHALGLGVGAAVAGRATDIWGPRRVLSIGAVLLAAGATICALATVLIVAVGGRGVLAMGSGAMTATALTLAAGRPPSQRPAVLARLGAAMALSSATAPFAGALAVTASWRAALVLPALSLTAIPLCWPLAQSRQALPTRVDWMGAGLLALTAAGLLLTIQSATLHFTPLSVAGLIAGTCVLSFLLHQHRGRQPAGFIPEVISQRRFLFAGLSGAGIYGGMFACVYAVPQLLTPFGHSARSIGLMLLPGAIVASVVARVAGYAASDLTRRRVLVAATMLFSASMLFAAADQRPATLMFATTAGFAAFAIAQTSLTAAITARVEPRQRGGALGLLNLMFFVGGALGAATCSALWQPLGLHAALAIVAAMPALAAAGARAALREPEQAS